MLKDIKDAIERSSPHLAGDFIGALSLAVMLVVGLHLPSLI